jgi:hypothetical protein
MMTQEYAGESARNMGVRMNTLHECFLSPKASHGGQTAYGHYVSVVVMGTLVRAVEFEP